SGDPSVRQSWPPHCAFSSVRYRTRRRDSDSPRQSWLSLQLSTQDGGYGMSQTLSPPPASVLIARPFERTGLPVDSSEIATNIRSQNCDEKKAWSKAVSAAAKQGDEAPEPCCKTLHISLCFDGTNNHELS